MRSASLTAKNLSSHRFSELIELEGDVTFDFFYEQDRSRWLGAFETEKRKRDEGDRFFAAKELVVRNYIANTPEEPFDKLLVPPSIMESPRSFLYTKLLGQMNFIKDYILPAIRKTGAFRPITEGMEKQFFNFDMKSFDIATIQIPDQYKLRQVFRVTFRVLFDLHKYVEYLIVKRRAKFELSIWPDFSLKVYYDTAFPFVLASDRNNFFNGIAPVVLAILKSNSNVLRYSYSTIKVRLDKVSGLQVRMLPSEAAFVVTTDQPLSMLTQLIAGRIDIFNKNQVSSSFKIQRLDPNVISKYSTHGSTGAGLLMYLTALSAVAATKKTIAAATPREIEKAMKDIKSGKIKIGAVK